MIRRFALVFCLAALSGCVMAQGPRPSNLGASNLDLGESGIQWYTTWESAEAEAKRSGRAHRNRPTCCRQPVMMWMRNRVV